MPISDGMLITRARFPSRRSDKPSWSSGRPLVSMRKRSAGQIRWRRSLPHQSLDSAFLHNKTPSRWTGFFNRKPKDRSEERLRLRDFARLDAARTNTQPLGSAVDHRLDCLQIHVPAAARDVVRVRNVVAVARPFAADVASLCHGSTPDSSINCGAGTSGLGAFSRLQSY